MKHYTVVFSALILSVLGEQEVEVVKSLSKHIGVVVLECQKEMRFKEDIINEFLRFWKPEHVLTKIEIGCVVACVLNKLELLEPGGDINKDNANAFLKANGADAKTTSKFISLYQLCNHSALVKRTWEKCAIGLEIAKCFRRGIFQMNWAPAFSVN